MQKEKQEKTEIKNYLLGLYEENKEKFEERLMTDDGFFEDFLANEEELIQEYVDGELSPLEKERFEEHFLISAERVEKVRFAESMRRQVDLRNLSKESETAENTELSANSESLFSKLFSRDFLPKLVPAVVALVVFAGVIWLAFPLLTGNGPSALEKEFAELNKGDFQNTSRFENSLSLIPGNLRSNTSDTVKFSKQNAADRLLIRLALPAKTDSPTSFEIELLKNGQVIFKQNEIKTYQNEGGEELRFLIPGSVLEKGEHQFRVSNENSRISYVFFVE